LPRDVGAIVVAAGSGSRFGGDMPKQFQPVAGVPMVLRALRPFVSHPDVAHVVLVLPRTHADQPPAFLADLVTTVSSASSSSAAPAASASASPLPAVLSIVAGGEHRGDSVRQGLNALAKECVVVLVHDGARPFVDRDVVDSVIGYARRGEGAVPAVPLTDTLKEAVRKDPSRISRTRPRAYLWRAQTPQGFPREMLENAHARAARLGRRASDDAALVEAMGLTVRLVPDSNRNLKITTREDLQLAELLAGIEP
jgi:2-C-methyl-D-erythritol 4-phosphate cytidylyltransferase